MADLTAEEKIEAGWVAWIQNECNNKFLDAEGALDLPPDIEYILLPYLIKTNSQDPNVASESVSDLSRSFHSSGLPDKMQKIIRNHRRLRFP